MDALLIAVAIWIGLNVLFVFWAMFKGSRGEDPLEFLMIFDQEQDR